MAGAGEEGFIVVLPTGVKLCRLEAALMTMSRVAATLPGAVGATATCFWTVLSRRGCGTAAAGCEADVRLTLLSAVVVSGLIATVRGLAGGAVDCVAGLAVAAGGA